MTLASFRVTPLLCLFLFVVEDFGFSQELTPPPSQARRSIAAERLGPEETITLALGGCWRIVSVVGFTPELSSCALCHTPLRETDDATFSHSAGGVVCPSCARVARGGRRIPATARAAMNHWLAGEVAEPLADAEGRSHQRLLREFLDAHMPDDRPLRAFAVWEHERWSAA